MSKNTTKSLRLSLLFVLPNHNSLISSKIHWSYFQLFFDVSNRNIEPGKRVGVHTVKEAVTCKYKTEFKATCVFYLSVVLGSASGCGPSSEGVDIALEHIHNIREALSELWEAVDDKAVEIRYMQRNN
ncbi:hypothetical protein YC2023_021885 [Brassica napus]